MKIHQHKEKMTLVCDREELFRIGLCLAESPSLKTRKLALEIMDAMNKLNQRVEEGKDSETH